MMDRNGVRTEHMGTFGVRSLRHSSTYLMAEEEEEEEETANACFCCSRFQPSFAAKVRYMPIILVFRLEISKVTS